jgi:hypothetical protein
MNFTIEFNFNFRWRNSFKFRKKNFYKSYDFFVANDMLLEEKQFQLDYLSEEVDKHATRGFLGLMLQGVITPVIVICLYYQHYWLFAFGVGLMIYLFFYTKNHRNQTILTNMWKNLTASMYDADIAKKYNF